MSAKENGGRGKIIVFGILFFYPLAGVTYQFLHYLLGLRKLGYDPYYVEDSARWVYDPRINDMTGDAEGNINLVAPILEAYGFADKWAFRGFYEDGKCYGMTEPQLLNLYREADAFLNVTGAQEIRDEQRAIPRRIYVESDPFLAQVRVAKGDPGTIDMLSAHDMHFTFGENLGAPDCPVPLQMFDWLPTRQPVAIELWQGSAPTGGDTYTTITTWSNKDRHIEYNGETYYWTKDREFLKFIELPGNRSEKFELAASVDESVGHLLRTNGWRNTPSVQVSEDLHRYRDYIAGSRGEFTVARDQYVRPNTGWFSDRSACYLAAGRPVITQETAFSKYLPTGKGLFGFTTMEDIFAALDRIESDYEGSCKAAREIASEYFDAGKVVGSLMERAGL